jgi:hypothetical protein
VAVQIRAGVKRCPTSFLDATVGEELLRLPGAGAPVIHLLASEEELRWFALAS